MNKPVQVLLIEDDSSFAYLVEAYLSRGQNDPLLPELELTVADHLSKALRFISQKNFDVVLIDLSLPDSFGLDTFHKICSATTQAALIVLSGNEDDRVAIQAMQAGAQDYIAKGRVDDYFLKRSLRYALERKREELQIQRQLERLSSLHQIDTAITSSFDLSTTLQVVVQQVVTVLHVHAATILLFNPRSQAIEHAADYGFQSDAIRQTRLRIGEGYSGQVMLGRNPIHIPDLQLAENGSSDTRRLAHEDFKEYYGTPLIVKGTIKGVLEVYHREPLHADQSWLDFMEVLARQAAIAIDNAQLFESLQQANAELERRVAERTAELNRTNTELEQANRAKSDFLAAMSHELRTPLNSILGLSESLMEQYRGPLNDDQQKYIQIIESSGRHLLELINDVLDLSKIEAGKFDYYPQIVDVDTLCRSCLAFVREQATKKHIQLKYDADLTAAQIHADPRRMKQILVNLLTNAVKFTPEHGQVTLQMEANTDDDLVHFSVIDNGIGIAPEDLKRLFQPFVQVDTDLNRRYTGTGLGLALVHRLTDLHGGSVHVESEVGKGSRFTVNIPWGRAIIGQQASSESGDRTLPSPTLAMVPENLVKHNTVLLAEDNLANILTIGEYLESRGYTVVKAHDGVEAIEQAKASIPDVILMDIQMPSVDGLEAMRRLRQDQRFVSTPIIALSALAMPGDRERCLEAGANEYLSKPVSLKQLVKLIEELTRNSH